MKKLLFILLLISSNVFADGPIVGPNCLITWDANPPVDLVTSYNVFCGTVTGTYNAPVNVTITQAACSQVSITTIGQKYCAITAVNSIGESGLSGEAPFTLLGLPGIVTGIKVSSLTIDAFMLFSDPGYFNPS
jgi:hypothetical protein